LVELGAAGKPTIYVLNKCDCGISDDAVLGVQSDNTDVARISAYTGEGIDEFVSILERKVLDGKKKISYLFPHTAQSILNILYNEAIVEECEYVDDGIRVRAVVDQKTRGRLAKYEV